MACFYRALQSPYAPSRGPNLLGAKAVLSANVYDASSLLGPLLRGQEKAP
jgi:hypothetical protein